MTVCDTTTYQKAVAVWGAEGGLYLLGNHLGDSETVVLADVVEETHSVVLHHQVVRGESFLGFVHPTLHHLTTPL